MISMLSDYTDAGIFSAAVRFLDPIFIFRNLVAVAFFPMFVKMFHKGTINGKRLFQVSLALGAFVFLGAAVASIIGPFVIIFLLPSFKASAMIFSILVFYTAFSYMIIPFSNALLATHNELIMLKVVWIPPIINILLNLVLFQFFGLVGIAYATLVVQTVSFALYLLITWTTLKRQGRII
jgi:O-antigen/teichoic acid export membrane protein